MFDGERQTMTVEEFGSGPFSKSFHEASELVGKRWTGAIIYAVFHGRTRFAEIASVIPGLSDRLLTERLKELVDFGILEKRLQDEASGRPSYHLTDKGYGLRDVMIALHAWAQHWQR